MSVRQSLLAILDQGPCYGYQLRSEYDRRTGATSALNVGQVYSTLDRLERDGLVSQGQTDPQGHVYYEITPSGSAMAREWIAAPLARSGGTRDDLARKIALAATLPGVDITAIVKTQRDASRAALGEIRSAREHDGDELAVDAADGERVARRLVADAREFHAEAEVRWLDHVASVLSLQPPHAVTLPLNAERPRRGRPPRHSTSPSTGSVLAGRTANE